MPVGSRAYASNTLESGWIPSPLPAVYTGEKMKKYREWLPANGYEGTGSIGGSFVSNNIEDYYMTPYELGYGPFVKFDHDFIGREALEKMAEAAAPQEGDLRLERRRSGEDLRLAVRAGRGALQVLRSADRQLRLVVVRQGRRWAARRSASRCSAATATTSARRCRWASSIPNIKVGDELTLVWGEEGGGTKKTTVERHKQLEVRVKVSPVPYARDAREAYHEGWRTRSA